MNVFRYSDAWKPYVTFKNATIAVVMLFIVTNAMWYAQGKPIVAPRQNIPWTARDVCRAAQQGTALQR